MDDEAWAAGVDGGFWRLSLIRHHEADGGERGADGGGGGDCNQRKKALSMASRHSASKGVTVDMSGISSSRSLSAVDAEAWAAGVDRGSWLGGEADGGEGGDD